ncbi:uncharacterized protein LOC120161741 [Hibiscus syriacus]|uniref:uncharacterized protein LOC120161741 n=1 Tax=Hibiscus syriacus TaxID=106335 RepID=UPI001920A6F5|nr:uncharacterized protein LOC120161741 [Hibiscus syriacus]
MLTCNISEYTRMVLREKNKIVKSAKHSGTSKKIVDSEPSEMILLQTLSVGFGDLISTAKNIRPGSQEPKLPEAAEIFIKKTSSCCDQIWKWCCCMSCIHCCSKMNAQCATTLTQLCTALACIDCFECCSELCCPGQDDK